jgi:hypothetical protein
VRKRALLGSNSGLFSLIITYIFHNKATLLLRYSSQNNNKAREVVAHLLIEREREAHVIGRLLTTRTKSINNKNK